MSQENVEIMRHALEAFAAADVERLLQFTDPDIEFEPHLAMLEGNYRGHGGIREFMADAFETLGGPTDRPPGYPRSRRESGPGSGIEDDVPFAIVARVRGGLIVHLKDYGNKVLALEAAGLSE